mgnify:CR=1 FL=1
MLKRLAKALAERLVGLVALLLVIGLLVLLWQHRDVLPTLGDMGLFFLGLLLWLAIATILPWATFFLVGWANKAESNLPAVFLLLAWALVDAALAWWLVRGWPVAGQLVCAVVAFLAGGLYNLIAANQIAARLQR